MTTQINDIHDLLRLLEERPDLAAVLRQRILTPELLAMPELTVRVDGLTEQVAELGLLLDEFIQEQRGFNRWMEGRVNTLTGRMGNLRGRQYERDLKRRLPNLL